MQKILNAFGFVAKSVGMRELFLLIGLGLIGYGTSLVYWPAAFALPGVIMILVAVFGVKGPSVVPTKQKHEETQNVRAIR